MSSVGAPTKPIRPVAHASNGDSALSAHRLPDQDVRAAGAIARRGIEDEVVAHFSVLAEMFALPRSYGQIYGLLFITARPLSFTDIVERLGLSKGSVSLGLKALRELGAIEPADGPDWRRDHFVAVNKLRALVAAYLNESIQPRLKEGLRKIEGARRRHRALLASKDEDGRLVQARLEQLHGWHRKGNALLPVVARFLG